MENRNKAKQVLKQKFLPYLVLRAHIFELPNVSLNEYIEELIESNPFVDEGDVVVYDEFDFTVDAPDDDIYSFLKRQVEVSQEDELIKDIANRIIDHLDGCGFLNIDESKFIKELNIQKRLFERALKFVQSLEPAGVGARTLAECLLLQLDTITPVEKRIILESLEPLMKEDYKPLIKKYKVSIEQLTNLRERLLSLDVCPARAFKNVNFVSRFPDIIIEKDGEEYRASLNTSSRKIVRLVENYAKIIDQLNDKLEKNELEELLNRAQWSLHVIEERDQLLESIGQKIAEENKEFFSNYCCTPKKFSLEDFVNESFDYSTLSRLIQNKYILTPKGIFPLRYFFKHKNEKFDEELVMKRIKEIIENEDKRNPLSDEDIEKILNKEGFEIKRRTITKYREKLNIPSSTKRKIS